MFSSWYINCVGYWYTHILNVLFVKFLYSTPENTAYSNSGDDSPQTWKLLKYFHKLGFSKQNLTRKCVSYALSKCATKQKKCTTKADHTLYFKHHYPNASLISNITQNHSSVQPSHCIYPNKSLRIHKIAFRSGQHCHNTQTYNQTLYVQSQQFTQTLAVWHDHACGVRNIFHICFILFMLASKRSKAF